MTKWVLFSALWWLTGNPLLALCALLLFALVVDRAFVGLLPDPLRGWRAWRRRLELNRCISNNPYDGPSLLGLGRDAVERWKHREARPLLERALERMPGEAEARYLLGLAEIGCDDVKTGIERIRALLAEQPRYRFGEPWLEVGARLLSLGRDREAVEALQGFVQIQPASVRGRYLLAIALARTGERARARQERRRAWEEFVTLPRFRRKHDRRYAWRANPRRPLLYGAVAIAMAVLVAAAYVGTGAAAVDPAAVAPVASDSDAEPEAVDL